RWRWQLPLLLGLVVSTTLPAFPRYGRFHLAAAVPLLGVIAGVVIVRLGAIVRSESGGQPTLRVVATLGCLFVATSFLWGGLLWWSAQEIGARLATPPSKAACAMITMKIGAFLS